MALKLDDKPEELYDDGHPSWQTNIQGLEDSYSGASASDGDLPEGHPSKGSAGKNLSDMESRGASPLPGSNAEQTEKKGLGDALGGGKGGAAGTAASWATNIAAKRVPIAWLGANKKKAAAGGGVIGAIIAFFVGTAIITQGPLQLIHAGQMLKGFHWSSNEEFGNERSGNLLFAAKNVLDGNAYRNNLGVVGNKFADTYDKRLAKQGIEFDRGNKRLAQSVTIDRNTDAGRKLEARLVSEGIDVTELDGGKIKVDLTVGDNVTKTLDIVSDGSLDAINRKGKASYVSRKILRLRNGTSWNVLQNKGRVKKQELGKYYAERREKRAEKRKQGSTDLDADKAKAQDIDTDSDGELDTPDPEAEKAAKAGNELVDEVSDLDVTKVDGQAQLGDIKKSLLQKLGPAGKVAGGAVAVVGLTCAARSLGNAAEDAQYANNILPMIRMGTDIISIASQVQSGQVNIDEVGSVVNEFFDETAKPEAKSFFAAKSIQVNQGNPNAGGPDLPEEANPGSLGKKPVVFEVIDQIPGMEQACYVSDTVGDLPVVKQFGEASNAIVSSGVEALTGKSTEDFVSMLVNYVAGNGVNVLAQGAELGNLANAGSFLAANENALSMGGRKLTDGEVAELREYNAEIQRRENSQKTFFARMFNLNDAQSLLSKNTVQNPNVASVSASTQSFLKAPASLLSNVSSILSPRAHAAATSYDFGVPTYGFSLSERRDARFSDPYESAEKIYDKLDKLNEEYAECFQVKITKDGKLTQEEGVPYTKIPDKCNGNSEDLLRYRFWIADTVLSKGLSCMDGMDENDCTELGFGSTGDTNEAAANASTSNPNLYMIGDSLSIHLREGGSADIVKRFKENGWTDVCVEAEEGRPLGASEMTQSFAEKGEPPIDCRGATNTKTKGLLQIGQQPDKDAIAKAGTVVISLGTNDGPSAFTSFRDNVKKMITDIRAINPAVQIKWINTYTARDVTSGGTYLLKDFAEMNKILGEVSKEMNFEVLDWNSVAAPNYSSDPIHPNPVKYADFILEKVGRPAVNSSGVSGVTCPENLEEKADRPGYFKMPDAPGGEYSIYSVPARRYGSKQLVCVLSTVAKAYNTLYAGRSKMDIGDLNADGHSSHYKGIAVDLDAKGELAAADHTGSKRGTYDKEATIALGKLLVDTGAIQNIWWCEPGAVGKPKGIAPRPEHLSGNDGTMNAIRDYAKEKGTPITLYCISGHQNHFHVDIKEEFALQGSWKP